MTKHRSHSAAFKRHGHHQKREGRPQGTRQVAQEFVAGETLHGLSKRHWLANPVYVGSRSDRSAMLLNALNSESSFVSDTSSGSLTRPNIQFTRSPSFGFVPLKLLDRFQGHLEHAFAFNIALREQRRGAL